MPGGCTCRGRGCAEKLIRAGETVGQERGWERMGERRMSTMERMSTINEYRINRSERVRDRRMSKGYTG